MVLSIRSQPPAPLDPDLLDKRTQESVRALMQEGSSPNTVAAYRAAIRYWVAWYALRYQRAFSLPLPAEVVVQFLTDHALRSTQEGLACDLPPAMDGELVRQKAKSRTGPLSLNTILHRIAVLSKAHQVHGHDNPCRSPAVQELVTRIRRAYARRQAAPARKEALTRDLLERLLQTCDESLRGRRDAALLLFAWSTGGRRRSEVVAATVENTVRAGEQAYLYTMGLSKTNQTGSAQGNDAKPLVGKAAQALTQWLEASGIRSGPIFRRVRRGDVLGEPLTAAAVRDIVQERCRLAGVEGDFSAHSLRSGFITEAGRQSIPLGETMALTGHSSVTTVMEYFRAGNALASPAARLLEE
jgi:integrase